MQRQINTEYKILCIRLVQKLGRRKKIPFKRGKLEIWASGVIYAIGQINYLFDKDFEPYVTAEDICKYFKTKKSTTSNKARDIRQMLNLKTGDRNFSTKYILEHNIRSDNVSRKSLRGAENMMYLQMATQNLDTIHKRRYR